MQYSLLKQCEIIENESKEPVRACFTGYVCKICGEAMGMFLKIHAEKHGTDKDTMIRKGQIVRYLGGRKTKIKLKKENSKCQI